MGKKPEEKKIIETPAIDQTAEPVAEEIQTEEIPAEEAEEPTAEEIPAEEAAPQGGTVTVQILGKAPRKCVIQAPMPLKEFLKTFAIKVNTKGGWRVCRDGSPIKGDAIVNPGDVLSVGKLNKNG